MQEAMVTARMSKEKKEAGARVLKSLGQTASQAINEFYDYLIAKRENPFAKNKEEEMKPGVRRFTPEQIAEAKAWLDSIRLPEGNRFANMTDDEIKRERLIARGLLEGDDVA